MSLLNIGDDNFDLMYEKLLESGANFHASFETMEGGEISIISDKSELTIWFNKDGVIDQIEIEKTTK